MSVSNSELPHWNNVAEMAQWVSENLYTAVISDALDSIGFRFQTLAPDIRPLDDSLVLAGTARTALWMSVDPATVPKANPYENEIKYLDSGRPGDVFVMSVERNAEIVPWGELLSTACLARGARGLVCDGLVRDSRKIKEMKLPVFCTGCRPLDSAGRGEIVAFDLNIEIDDVKIHSGDFIVADADGVVVIPSAMTLSILQKAWQKVAGENRTRAALQQGRLLGEVFKEYGIL